MQLQSIYYIVYKIKNNKRKMEFFNEHNYKILRKEHGYTLQAEFNHYPQNSITLQLGVTEMDFQIKKFIYTFTPEDIMILMFKDQDDLLKGLQNCQKYQINRQTGIISLWSFRRVLQNDEPLVIQLKQVPIDTSTIVKQLIRVKQLINDNSIKNKQNRKEEIKRQIKLMNQDKFEMLQNQMTAIQRQLSIKQEQRGKKEQLLQSRIRKIQKQQIKMKNVIEITKNQCLKVMQYQIKKIYQKINKALIKTEKCNRVMRIINKKRSEYMNDQNMHHEADIYKFKIDEQVDLLKTQLQEAIQKTDHDCFDLISGVKKQQAKMIEYLEKNMTSANNKIQVILRDNSNGKLLQKMNVQERKELQRKKGLLKQKMKKQHEGNQIKSLQKINEQQQLQQIQQLPVGMNRSGISTSTAWQSQDTQQDEHDMDF